MKFSVTVNTYGRVAEMSQKAFSEYNMHEGEVYKWYKVLWGGREWVEEYGAVLYKFLLLGE